MLGHPQLRHSEALEVFLICQTKEEFGMRVKELEKKLKKSGKIERMMGKKAFEYLKAKEPPLKNVKVARGSIDLKISRTLRRYYEEFLGKVNCFETTFQEVELLATELTRLMDKVG